MPLPSFFKPALATVCYTSGLALSLFLAFLKLSTLPCLGPGGCQAVLYSKYGSVFHIPVGVFGAALWIGCIFVRDKNKRDLLLIMLAAGTAFFMVIQFGVLRGFCLYCTLHAVAAWGALFLHHERPRYWMALLACLLAGGGFLYARQQAVVQAREGAGNPSRLIALADHNSALPWLGTIHPRSPVLILSLDCPACLDLLEQIQTTNLKAKEYGPALYLKVSDRNRALTLGFVAAVLSQGDLPRRDAFLATAAVLLMEKENTLSSPDSAAARLAAFFPAALEKASDAGVILDAQSRILTQHDPGAATPLLVTRDGRFMVQIKPADLTP